MKYKRYEFRPMEIVFKSFFERIVKTETCWIWKGLPGAGGYGQMCFRGVTRKAHRVSYELFKGAIPPKKIVMHTCDKPDCVNPSHLKIGTQKESVKDCIDKNRFKGFRSGQRFKEFSAYKNWEVSKGLCKFGHDKSIGGVYVNQKDGYKCCMICKIKYRSEYYKKGEHMKKQVQTKNVVEKKLPVGKKKTSKVTTKKAKAKKAY